LTEPTAAAIEVSVAAASHFAQTEPRFLSAAVGLKDNRLPFAFSRDYSESLLGRGDAVLARARHGFERWEMFDLGWVSVANLSAAIAPGQTVCVKVFSLGLWSLNLSRIVDIVDTPNRFGFIYATTELHLENGEERFLLDFDPGSGHVRYILEAVSRPRNTLAQLGFPITRAFQHRFARESHLRMQQIVQNQGRTSCRTERTLRPG
jgi:uncharacterized protein (UPF0548 family)